MIKKGSAVWRGTIKEGKGSISTETGALKDAPYGFGSRFSSEAGTNPEELIAAAHAACFSMALSLMLGEAGHVAESISTDAEVRIEKKDDGFTIVSSHLNVNANVPGIPENLFNEIAGQAKTGCPVSKLLNAEISMDARLTQEPG